MKKDRIVSDIILKTEGVGVTYQESVVALENVSLDTSNNIFKYGMKYKFQVKAGNDAGAIADNDWSVTEWKTADSYTSVPLPPPIDRIDNVNIISKLWNGSWDEIYQFDSVSLDSFAGGTDGIYYSYKANTAQWIKHSEDPDEPASPGESGRKLFRDKLAPQLWHLKFVFVLT